MIFFDYVYYKSCKWYYSYKYSRNEYKISGLMLTCGYIGFNTVIIVGFIEYYFDIKLIDSKYEILYYPFNYSFNYPLLEWRKI